MFPPRRDPWVVAVLLFFGYGSLSLTRHLAMESTGYDLGIFEEAVRAYARFRPPVAEIKAPGFNLLGDHFHPVIALVAPLYRLVPGAATLLLVQAALLAVSAVPVTRLAADRLGRRAGLCAGLAYGLSWGIQQAADFDFHEIAFAVPLIACSVDQLARRRWARAACWAVPLLLVKEDQALTVAAIGAYIYWRGSRRIGGALFVGAVGFAFLVMKVVIPAFSPGHDYRYTAALQGDANLLHFFVPVDTKGWTVLALLLPTLFLAVRSPLVLIGVPCVAARFWATVPNYWGTHFHYSAVLMPIVFIAAIDGMRGLNDSVRSRAPVAMLAAALAITLLAPQPLVRLLDPATWRAPARYRAAAATLARIPDGADVAASNRLAPQLTGRCRVFRLLASPPWRRPEWAAAVVGTAPFGPLPAADAATLRGLLQAGYAPVAQGGGVVIYRLRH
jgi:uncharacterized membrane protein